MSDIYFFTNPAFLAQQNNEDAYGEIMDSVPPSPISSNSFSVTSMHRAADGISNLEDIPAYAVCDGQVFVQDSDALDGNGNKLLNIILKPNDPIGLGTVNIRYFIYKGIMRESLLKGTGSTLSIADKDTNDLTKVIYEYNEKRNLTGDPSVNSIGYNFISENDTEFFEKTVFFLKPQTSSNPKLFEFAFIKAGKTIGSFIKDKDSSKIGFEVILQGTKQKLTFGDIRANKKIITIPSTTTGDTALAIREKILDYIDPCAFFGSFYFEEKGIKTNSGKQVRDDIYNNVIKSFVNKNTIYLDIRNENGYSFPYRGYYSDSIKISSASTTYSTFLWPIKKVVISTGLAGTGVNKISVNLPRGENRMILVDDESLLYTASGYFFDRYPFKGKKQETSRFKKINYISSTDTEEIQLAYPTILAGPAVCTYIQLHYIKKNNSYDVSAGYKILPTLSQLDNLFPIREMLELLPPANNNDITFVKSYGMKFIDNTYVIDNVIYGFSGMMEYGIAYYASIAPDDNKVPVILYAYPIDAYFDGGFQHYGYKSVEIGTEKDFFKKLTDTIGNAKISKCSLNITGSLAGTISVESIPNDSTTRDFRAKYNCYAIALTKNEFQLLKTNADSLYKYTTEVGNKFDNTSGYHYETVVLRDINILSDSNHKLYINANIKLSGFNINNVWFENNDVPLQLYSSDGVFFCSADFFKTVSSNNFSCLSDNKIEFSDEDKGGVIKRLSQSPTSYQWPLYQTFDDTNIDIGIYQSFPAEMDYYGESLTNKPIIFFSGTRVVILELATKKVIGHNVLFHVYRIVCFYNNRFREGWISQQSLINSSHVLQYKNAGIGLPANNRTYFYNGYFNYQNIDRENAMYTFFNDAYMDLNIVGTILSDFQINDGNFYKMYNKQKEALELFIKNYAGTNPDTVPKPTPDEVEDNKTEYYNKLLNLSKERDKKSPNPLSDIINYELDELDGQAEKFIDPVATLKNFSERLKEAVDNATDYDNILLVSVSEFWLDKLTSDDAQGLDSIQDVLTKGTASYNATTFWSQIILSNPNTPAHVLPDIRQTDLDTDVYKKLFTDFKASFQSLIAYIQKRSTNSNPVASSEATWLNDLDISQINKFLIINSDSWPSDGTPDESKNKSKFSTEDYNRIVPISEGTSEVIRYLQLDSSYSIVNCNNVFAVFANEITQIDSGFIKAGGNTESGYEKNTQLSASNVFWAFTKNKSFAEMLLPYSESTFKGLDFVTDSGIEYIGPAGVQGMRLKDFFQRNPVFSLFYLKAFIDYLDSNS